MAREKMYKNMKISERMILFLKDQYGCIDYPSKNKYIMLKTTTLAGGDKYFFIGNNGAVRINSKPSATDTISMSDKYQRLLAAYEQLKGLEVK